MSREAIVRRVRSGYTAPMSWTGVILLAVVAVSLSVYILRRKSRARRKPTRPMAEMDHEVHERIRAISAESRYSSAGIEF